MDYENKYNNALKKLQEALASKDGCKISGLTRACIEEIFPELKESEDERIRKELIEHIKANQETDYVLFQKFSPEDVIAWLEKLKVFSEHGDGLYYFGNNGFTYVGNTTYDNVSWLEKQCEKPQGKSALEAWKEKKVDNRNKVASAWNNGYCIGYIRAVDKASEWLENHNDYIDVKDGNVTYFDMEKCVEDLRKYMRGGEE